MKGMRKTLPSAESQKPTTLPVSVAPLFPNDPASVALVNGLRTSGAAMSAVTSTKSYASVIWVDCEKRHVAWDGRQDQRERQHAQA
jgi:hypothetical protein